MLKRYALEAHDERTAEFIEEMLQENGFIVGKQKVKIGGNGICGVGDIYTR